MSNGRPDWRAHWRLEEGVKSCAKQWIEKEPMRGEISEPIGKVKKLLSKGNGESTATCKTAASRLAGKEICVTGGIEIASRSGTR